MCLKRVVLCRFYKKLAIGVLGECYLSDPDKVTLLVVRQMSNYDTMTPLQLAVQADNQDFVAHAVCQNVLTAIWYGRLVQDDTYLNLKVVILPGFIFYIELVLICCYNLTEF